MNLINQPKNIFLLFIGTAAIGIMVTFVCSSLILIPYFSEISNKTFDMLSLPREKIISIQAINMIGFFIIPPILFALFSKNDFIHVYNLDKAIQWKPYLYALLLALVLFPILINIQHYTTRLPFPESFKSYAELQKVTNEKIIKLFLDYPGVPNLLMMVGIIGIGAGLTEELFFRGLFMPLLSKLFNSSWSAIIISGIIFSAFHANIYDFLPISFVGILLGYIYTQTGDLKLNIFLHAVYNSFQVILNYLHNHHFIQADIDKIESVPMYVSIVCIALAGIFVTLIIKSNEHVSLKS